jgi:hypothetical protein
MYGLAGAMDTLCGQAYGGRNFRMIGIVAQRACLIMCAVSVPLVLVWTQLKHPAILFGLSAEIVEAASRYMLWIAPQLPFHALTAVIHKFQTSQVHSLSCPARIQTKFDLDTSEFRHEITLPKPALLRNGVLSGQISV